MGIRIHCVHCETDNMKSAALLALAVLATAAYAQQCDDDCFCPPILCSQAPCPEIACPKIECAVPECPKMPEMVCDEPICPTLDCPIPECKQQFATGAIDIPPPGAIIPPEYQ